MKISLFYDKAPDDIVMVRRGIVRVKNRFFNYYDCGLEKRLRSHGLFKYLDKPAYTGLTPIFNYDIKRKHRLFWSSSDIEKFFMENMLMNDYDFAYIQLGCRYMLQDYYYLKR